MIDYILLQAASTDGNSMHQFVLIGGVVLVFYFFMIRPQQKRQKAQKDLLQQIKKGDQLVTIGGIHGKVCEVADDTVLLEIDSKGAKVTIAKSAISLESSSKQQVNKK